MKTRKRILATLLSVAVAATTVLPGAITANAATIVTTTPGEAVETGAWSENMDRVNSGGELYWHIQSALQDVNPNNNSDYSVAAAPMVVLDMRRDMLFDGTEFSVSTDIYPNGTQSGMRFGIMVKYVDPTHWAYLNYDVGKWLLEFKCDSLGGYPAIPALTDNPLTDYKDTNVTVTYKSESVIEITITPDGGEPVVATIDDMELTNGDVPEEDLSNVRYKGVLSALENYAIENDMEIRYGFKAAAYNGVRTDVNLKNMTYKGKSMMNDSWEAVVEREGQILDKNDPIGGKNYSLVDAKAAAKTVSYTELTEMESGTVSAVLRPATDGGKFALAAKHTDAGDVKVGYDGSKWYYSVGSTKTQTNANVAVEKDKDYQINMTLADGKLSAGVVPVDVEGAEEVAIASNVDVSSVAKGTIAVSAEAGTELWIRNVNYEKREYSDTTELNNRYNEIASATNLAANNADNKYFTAAWATFKTAADGAKEKIDADVITSEEAASALSTLNSAYTTLGNNVVQESRAFTNLKNKLEEAKTYTKETENATYSDETWNAFVTARDAAQKIVDDIAKTPYENERAITNTRALSELTSKMNALALLANDQEKADLQAAVTEANKLNASHYEEAGWTDFAAARDEAAAVLANAQATKDEITDALTALNSAKENLVIKTATVDDIAASTTDIEKIKNEVNGKLVADAAYNNALQAVEALLKKENVTKKEIDEAMAALETAKAALKPVQQTPAPVPTETLKKGQTEKVGKMTYKVLDVAKKTVALTKGLDKKNVTIPATVNIKGETCKVVTIAKGAFKGYKKLTSVTIGKNVTKIEGNAFNNCKKLKKVTFKGASVKTINKTAFKKTASSMTVKVPKSLKSNKNFKKKLTNAGMKKVTIK